MKKEYLIPATKVTETVQKEIFIACSEPTKGVDDFNSKDISNVDASANDDDFWSTSK